MKHVSLVLVLLLVAACSLGAIASNVKGTSLQTHTTAWNELDDSWDVTVNSAYHVHIENNMVATGIQYLIIMAHVSTGGYAWRVYFDDNASDLLLSPAMFHAQSNTIDLYVSGITMRYVVGAVNATSYSDTLDSYPDQIHITNGDGDFTGGSCSITLEGWTPPVVPQASASGHLLASFGDSATSFGLTQDSNYLYDAMWGSDLYMARISKSDFSADNVTLTSDYLSGYQWCGNPIVDNGYCYAIARNFNGLSYPLELFRFSTSTFAEENLTMPVPLGDYTFTCNGLTSSGGSVYALLQNTMSPVGASGAFLVQVSESSFTETGNVTLDSSPSSASLTYFTSMASSGGSIYLGASSANTLTAYVVKCSTSPLEVVANLTLTDPGLPVTLMAQGGSLYFAAESNGVDYLTEVDLGSFTETSQMTLTIESDMIGTGQPLFLNDPAIAYYESTIYALGHGSIWQDATVGVVDPSAMSLTGDVVLPVTFNTVQFVAVDSSRNILYATCYEDGSSLQVIVTVDLPISTSSPPSPGPIININPFSPSSPIGFVTLPGGSRVGVLGIALVIVVVIAIAIAVVALSGGGSHHKSSSRSRRRTRKR